MFKAPATFYAPPGALSMLMHHYMFSLSPTSQWLWIAQYHQPMQLILRNQITQKASNYYMLEIIHVPGNPSFYPNCLLQLVLLGLRRQSVPGVPSISLVILPSDHLSESCDGCSGAHCYPTFQLQMVEGWYLMADMADTRSGTRNTRSGRYWPVVHCTRFSGRYCWYWWFSGGAICQK